MTRSPQPINSSHLDFLVGQNPSPPSSLLKRKDAIIAKSMAVIKQHIDQWLDSERSHMIPRANQKRKRDEDDEMIQNNEDNHT